MPSSDLPGYDIAIIGGGTMGLSAAYYAAAAGYRTVLFEQFDFYNDRGSSDGDSRMFRVLYSDPNMARLAETSLGLWNEISNAAQVKLLHRNGLLFYGLPGDSVEGDLQQSEQVMTALGIPFLRYNREAMKWAYPIFKDVPQKYFGLSQATGATIEVQKSLRTFHNMAEQKGALLLARCPAQVRASSPGAMEFVIDTVQGEFRATHMILCPGAWSNDAMAPFGFHLNLKIWQMTVAYFKVDPADQWPMWYEFGPTVNGVEQLYYGFPPIDVPGMIKVSADFSFDIYDNPSQCTYKPDPRILTDLSTFLGQRFNKVSTTPQNVSTCLYTMSADGQIILDNLPGYKNVSVITGESGRGFKYTPLFGRILVELATTGKSAYDISEFRFDRKGLAS